LRLSETGRCISIHLHQEGNDMTALKERVLKTAPISTLAPAVLLLLARSAQAASDLDSRVAAVENAAKAAQSAGDNAWMLTSAALVLMMTGPGLALFYGGLVRRKNVLGTMMQSFIMMAVV